MQWQSLLLFLFSVCTVYSYDGVFDESKASINPNSFQALRRSADSYPYVIVYRGFCYSSSGYGQEARAFIKGLVALGIPIVLEPQEQVAIVESISDQDNELLRSLEIKDVVKYAREQKAKNKIVVALSHTSPDVAAPMAWADYNIARTMWEMQDIPQEWVTRLSQLDEIWVTSTFNKNSFSSSGIPEDKLFIVGECIDEDYYSDSAIYGTQHKEVPRKRKINFISLFNWNYRKGWDVLVEAFASEFSPTEDVALFIKTLSSWGKGRDYFTAEIVRVLKEKNIADKFPSNIYFISEGFSEKEMPYLYKAFDAFVLPTRAEGWGRPTMEAMLSGVPVVTTKYSGQEEFITSKNAYVIPHKITDVSAEAAIEYPLYEGGKWAAPSVTELRKILRKLSKSPKDAKKKAKAGQEFVIDHFSTAKVTSRMRDRIDEVVAKLKKS